MVRRSDGAMERGREGAMKRGSDGERVKKDI